MESWKYAVYTIIGFVFVAGSGMMVMVLRKLEQGLVHTINWLDIIILSTTAAVGLVMLILGIRNLVRIHRNLT